MGENVVAWGGGGEMFRFCLNLFNVDDDESNLSDLKRWAFRASKLKFALTNSSNSANERMPRHANGFFLFCFKSMQISTHAFEIIKKANKNYSKTRFKSANKRGKNDDSSMNEDGDEKWRSFHEKIIGNEKKKKQPNELFESYKFVLKSNKNFESWKRLSNICFDWELNECSKFIILTAFLRKTRSLSLSFSFLFPNKLTMRKD